MGFYLEITRKEKFEHFLLSFNSNQDFPEFHERTTWIIRYMIQKNDWVKTEELCEKLYLSQPTLSQQMKLVKIFLEHYSLNIVQKPRYGMKIMGREFDKRLCLANSYNDELTEKNRNFGQSFTDEDIKDIEIIVDCVARIQNKYQISMSEVSFQNFVIHIFVGIHRMLGGSSLQTSNEMINDISKWPENGASHDLGNLLEQAFHMKIDDNERVSFAIHLAAKRIIHHPDESIHQLLREHDINKLTDMILNTIKKDWHIDFSEDENFIKNISLHLLPMDVRLRYKVVLRNPMLEDIKRENMFAYILANSAGNAIKKYNEYSVDEDEIGYIALHIHLALLRRRENRNQKNITVICGMGRGTSHTLAFRLKELFGSYINEIHTAEVSNLPQIQNTDLIISSIPIHSDLKVPIMRVNYFLKDYDIQKLQTYFEDKSKESLCELKALMFRVYAKNIESTNELIKLISRKINQDITHLPF